MINHSTRQYFVSHLCNTRKFVYHIEEFVIHNPLAAFAGLCFVKVLIPASFYEGWMFLYQFLVLFNSDEWYPVEYARETGFIQNLQPHNDQPSNRSMTNGIPYLYLILGHWILLGCSVGRLNIARLFCWSVEHCSVVLLVGLILLGYSVAEKFCPPFENRSIGPSIYRKSSL